MYKVHIDDRNYESYSFFDSSTLDKIELPAGFNPLTHHLFTNDLFSLQHNPEKVEVMHSNVRNYEYISGILVLEGNKSYGLAPNLNSPKKQLYKCIPDDIHLPSFLVPYEHKHVGFSKIFVNQYITFKFTRWFDRDKHPIGQIVQLIGPVDVLDNFYEYQLYCKSLYSSIQKFTKDTLSVLKTNTSDNFIEDIKTKYALEDRTHIDVFSIDPPGCVDFDDAFSIKHLDSSTYILSIYISNVTIWLDHLNLWQSFSKRISTIYLPDKKRPMLPTILSDCLCSLQEGQQRFAITMDIYISQDSSTNSDEITVTDIKYSNCCIKVKKNYVYEEKTLFKNSDYPLLKDIVKKLNKTNPNKYIHTIKDSHDVVEYLMVFMNHKCAQQLLQNNCGIFRNTTMTYQSPNQTQTPTPAPTPPPEIANFAKIWATHACGQYVNIAPNTPQDTATPAALAHQFLELDSYIHITSPIRRLVDLLNIIQFQMLAQVNMNTVLSEKAVQFYECWTSPEKMEYINTTTKSIRKVQNDCSLLHLCFSNPSIMENIYDGYVIDIVEHNNGLFQYIIYIATNDSSLTTSLSKILCKIVLREKLELYQKNRYKMFIFNNESKLKKKIRLQFIS